MQSDTIATQTSRCECGNNTHKIALEASPKACLLRVFDTHDDRGDAQRRSLSLQQSTREDEAKKEWDRGHQPEGRVHVYMRRTRRNGFEDTAWHAEQIHLFVRQPGGLRTAAPVRPSLHACALECVS